jgi:hypothetical protein
MQGRLRYLLIEGYFIDFFNGTNDKTPGGDEFSLAIFDNKYLPKSPN